MGLWRDKGLAVSCDAAGVPSELYLGSGFFRVRDILDRWSDTGCWWEGEKEKVFYRLSCQDGPVCEIYHEIGTRNWFLYKVYD